MEVLSIYKKPQTEFWQGRNDGNDSLNRRFFQIIELRDIDELQDQENRNTFCLLGFECDEGVRRNKGRIGARKAPNEIRRHFGNLPVHIHENVNIFDTGNVVCEGSDLETAQHELGTCIQHLLKTSAFPVILGGGHETLYGHYLGVRSHLGDSPSIGIINIDAHFDLREDPVPTSGTMFRQILEQDKTAGYLVLGIQPFGNTKKLFATAEQYNCTYVLEEDIENFQNTFRTIDQFCQNYDAIILTLCSDVLCADAAPGVSAPSPFGLDPKTVRKLLRYIAKKPHLLSFDISEVNPLYDIDGKTAKLAAFFVAEVITNRLQLFENA